MTSFFQSFQSQFYESNHDVSCSCGINYFAKINTILNVSPMVKKRYHDAFYGFKFLTSVIMSFLCCIQYHVIIVTRDSQPQVTEASGFGVKKIFVHKLHVNKKQLTAKQYVCIKNWISIIILYGLPKTLTSPTAHDSTKQPFHIWFFTHDPNLTEIIFRQNFIKWSLQIFAHVLTLSWHVQIFVAIWCPGLEFGITTKDYFYLDWFRSGLCWVKWASY